MNNKIIAAGVVVALCAVALIGVGYAYTATVTNDNTFQSEYVVLDIKDWSGGQHAETLFTGTLTFSTSTTTDGTKWTAISQKIENAENVNFKATATNLGPEVTSIKLALTTGFDAKTGEENHNSAITAGLLGSGATITFKDTSETNKGADVVYTSNGTTWVNTNDVAFTLDHAYSATLVTAAITVGIASAPDVHFTMTLEYTGTDKNVITP